MESNNQSEVSASEGSEKEYIHVLKPTSAVVFGVINICFALWGIFGLIISFLMKAFIPMDDVQKSMQMPLAYEIISSVVGLMIASYLLVNGIMLLKGTMKARKGFIIYCIGIILISPLLQIYPMIHILGAVEKMPHPEMMKSIMIPSMIFGFLLGLTYPVIGLIFMTRKSVKEHYMEYNHPDNMANPKFSEQQG